MQTMVPKSWRLCAIRPSACCAGLAFLPLQLVCATTVVIPTRFSTSYPSLLGRTHKPCGSTLAWLFIVPRCITLSRPSHSRENACQANDMRALKEELDKRNL